MVKLRKKKLKNGNISLYLDIYYNGKRQYEFLRLYLTKDKILNKETLNIANNYLSKKIIELQGNNYNYQINKNVDFIEYSKNFSDKSYYVSVKNLVYHFNNYTNKKGILINNIDSKLIENFKTYLDKLIHKNTVFLYLSMMKIILNQAVKENIIIINPFSKVLYKVKRIETKREYLTIDEIIKLNNTDCKNKEVKKAFLFSCFTGLRLCDIRNIQYNNIINGNIELIQKKTSEILRIPVSETALKLIEIDKIKNIDNYIFHLPTLVTIEKVLKEWINTAGINKKITYHNSRHSFATMNLTYGNDIYITSKLLGHKNIKTTELYTKVVNELKEKAINNLPKII